MTPPLTGLIVDLLGFLTGTVLYAMLVVMVWRDRAASSQTSSTRRGLLPLATGCCGLLWNVGALVSFGPRVASAGVPAPAVVAIAFGALGFLPAVVVHSLLEGRETAVRRRFIRPVIAFAYALSAIAALLHVASALRGLAVPSPPALWLSTAGFGALAMALLFATRRQPIGRRGVWVVALSVFAVSALHFARHSETEPWWIELIGHHASLPLALAILHQDYRFALADLFLKNAIALLMLMAASLVAFSGVIVPLLRWQTAEGHADPRALALMLLLWMATVLAFPLARRLADRFVDRAVLRRPDYHEAITQLATALETASTEDAVCAATKDAVERTWGVTDASLVDDPCAAGLPKLVLSGTDLRAAGLDASVVCLLRIPTVDAPHRALAFGPPAAGRRLLSDDERLLEGMGRTTARRVDGLRVARERVERDLREQQMQRLASEAELRALRAQLHPHFLFNALTTIGYLIQHAPARALDTLMQLTSVLRGVLRRSTTEFSSLGDEIDLIAAYLDIEQARFEERLRVTIDVAPDARDAELPTLLLQPLVENAIRHGLSPTRAGGAVRIAARIDGGDLVVAIDDTGTGFQPAAAATAGGVGLRSVGERLRAHFGDRARLDIDSRVGAGTAITIRLPAARAARDRARRAV
jgi:two-component system LytT family sensor kinase